MMSFLRLVGSLLILVWGCGMVVLGAVANVITWVVTGLIVAAIGLPLLAASPWAPEWQTLMRRQITDR